MELFGISGEIFLAIAGMAALLASVFLNKDNSYRITVRLCNLSFLITIFLILFSYSHSGSLFNEAFIYDDLARFQKY